MDGTDAMRLARLTRIRTTWYPLKVVVAAILLAVVAFTMSIGEPWFLVAGAVAATYVALGIVLVVLTARLQLRMAKKGEYP